MHNRTNCGEFGHGRWPGHILPLQGFERRSQGHRRSYNALLIGDDLRMPLLLTPLGLVIAAPYWREVKPGMPHEDQIDDLRFKGQDNSSQFCHSQYTCMFGGLIVLQVISRNLSSASRLEFVTDVLEKLATKETELLVICDLFNA